jgi:hypothetical protein
VTPLSVGAHDQIDIVGAQPQRLEGLGDLVGGVDGQIQSALAAVLAGELLDRFPDRRGVGHRHQLGQMLGEHLEIQHLMAVMQLIQKQAAPQICWDALQLLPHPRCLLVQSEHPRGEPAGQP